MKTVEFLEKCIKSDELRTTIRKTGFNDSMFHCIDSCIYSIVEEDEEYQESIEDCAKYLDEWIESMEDYESIDDLLGYCSPEFNKLVEETA